MQHGSMCEGCIIVLDIQSVTCSCLVRAGSSRPTDLQVQCLICVSDPECWCLNLNKQVKALGYLLMCDLI